jgi:hypothetical protein
VVAPLQEIDHLVTDADEDATRAFAAAGVGVVAI